VTYSFTEVRKDLHPNLHLFRYLQPCVYKCRPILNVYTYQQLHPASPIKYVLHKAHA
jgi:hypothetical protein